MVAEREDSNGALVGGFENVEEVELPLSIVAVKRGFAWWKAPVR